MDTTYTQVDGEAVPVLAVEGQLSQNEVERFDNELSTLAAKAGKDRVVDLEACDFITSLVIPSLLKAHDAARDAGARLLIAAGSQLRMVLTVLRLEERLDVYETRAACLQDADPGGEAG